MATKKFTTVELLSNEKLLTQVVQDSAKRTAYHMARHAGLIRNVRHSTVKVGSTTLLVFVHIDERPGHEARFVDRRTVRKNEVEVTDGDTGLRTPVSELPRYSREDYKDIE